ncbi:mobile mystery protein A [Brevundimonas sp. BAL450]|nr:MULTISPECIES: mobile mystery protein A [Brevundimonas]MBG7614120.1 mobile mystery protein A [Brevundimonas sp. BAL450]
MDQRALARKHLDRQLKGWRTLKRDRRPPHGWIRAIRDALGMSSRQAAMRMGIAQSTYTRFEQNEADDAITLATLRKAAGALDCTLVYALVPNRPLEDTVRERARQVADRRLGRVHHTMRLEDQAMTPDDLALERERLVDDILRNDMRRLWDDA